MITMMTTVTNMSQTTLATEEEVGVGVRGKGMVSIGAMSWRPVMTMRC
eukprot:COSAG06_NODE_56318_length_285_cov_0.913978_1_plen_47_part_01